MDEIAREIWYNEVMVQSQNAKSQTSRTEMTRG
jgi:hypothetical protein